jgi:hypothetical protein
MCRGIVALHHAGVVILSEAKDLSAIETSKQKTLLARVQNESSS